MVLDTSEEGKFSYRCEEIGGQWRAGVKPLFDVIIKINS
jgi:hypothetical protein